MPLFDDDDTPRPKPARLAPLKLDSLGVEELRDYIGELQSEIGRAEAEIQRKAAHRDAAAIFFRKPLD